MRSKRHVGMKLETWVNPREQECTLGSHKWCVPRLFELARNLPVMEIPLNHLNVYYTYSKLTLREMVMHMVALQNADLSFPIILDEDGELMDGRHRIMRAMLEGRETIKAVRFDKNPNPDRIESSA